MKKPALPFAQTWLLSDTEAYLSLYDAAPDHTDTQAFDAWRETWWPHRTRLMQAVGEHLAYLAQSGALSPIDSMGLDVQWVNAWNRLFGETETERDRVSAASPFSTAVNRAINGSFVPTGAKSPEALHSELVSAVEAGNWEWFDAEGSQDAREGYNVYAEVAKWKPVLGRLARGPEGGKFEPFTVPLPPPGVVHLTIPVPTGELWVADWFRINDFTQAMRAIEDTETSELQVCASADSAMAGNASETGLPCPGEMACHRHTTRYQGGCCRRGAR